MNKPQSNAVLDFGFWAFLVLLSLFLYFIGMVNLYKWQFVGYSLLAFTIVSIMPLNYSFLPHVVYAVPIMVAAWVIPKISGIEKPSFSYIPFVGFIPSMVDYFILMPFGTPKIICVL
ncbi:hypothetical protein LZS85_15475 [Aliivibrio fischeri]|uniref:hypothetical protein n=1 Tax=Aliivibrio fischeri TaxID=668 RepID=UPI001F40C5C1|nr:hypothetical protein [Aliivibrio fischeri]MCE7567523.1 hypothetical protein [Aliivibrio fischeri]